MDAAAIILAGGNSSRFRANKALAKLSSQRMIDRVVCGLRDFFPRLILVTNTPDDFRGDDFKDVDIISDLIPGKGPLSGIHAGLVASPHSLNFVTACDMPFVSGAFAAYLVRKAEPGDDAIVPFIGGYAEPLAAVYRRTCIPYVEASLLSERYQVKSFYDQVRVRYVTGEEIASFGGADCFFNINTREDLKKASLILDSAE
jgi:molybdopterin-guanine dinucleotide biosynthesis protein A